MNVDNAEEETDQLVSSDGAKRKLEQYEDTESCSLAGRTEMMDCSAKKAKLSTQVQSPPGVETIEKN